jgi:dTDP-4-amino-4,6-dideoxygalactose transaminase
MQIPLVDLKAQYRNIKADVDAAVHRVMDHAGFILGKEVSDFELAFAKYLGAESAVGVASGTAALHLSLLACGIGPGDEVITSAHSFIATAEAISLVGARPVFVDINPMTYTMEPNLVEAAITPKTRAIIPVHIYGHPADMVSLVDIAERRNLYMIEDAAQAHGACQNDRRCGTFGHLSCFSFFPGKNLGAYGDAGAASGRDQELLAKVRKLRNHGRLTKYEHDEIGLGERLDAMQAAVLSAKLPYLEQWTTLRRAHAAEYSRLLAGGNVGMPVEGKGAFHVYHLYVVRSTSRDTLLDYLRRKGIEAGIHYPIPIHKQPAYLKAGYKDLKLPATERAAAEVLSLPLYPELTREQLEFVADAVRHFQ